MEIIFVFILLLYTLLIINYIIGWKKIKPVKKSDYLPYVSVVIAVRNEENEINRLLNNLALQIYPKQKLEFILVNDHSTDNTRKLLEQSSVNNLRLINLKNGLCGKKNAVSQGIDLALGEIILTSDADCTFSPLWVQNMVNSFAVESVKFVSGPVTFHKISGIFHSLQALEFLSLITSGASAIAINNPIFCNAANMAFRKKDFLELNNFNDNNIASGDDVFLLHSIKKRYPKGVVFVKEKDAIVKTNSVDTIKKFFSQRRRWTAKTTSYKDLTSIYVASLVLLVNFLVVFLFFTSFFIKNYFYFFLILYFFKFFIDFYFLYPSLKFFKRLDLIKWIFPFEFFYSCYIILIVFLSFSMSFTWKDRVYKK